MQVNNEDIRAAQEYGMFWRVIQMHEHFGISWKGEPRHLVQEEKQFRVDAMQEELDEYKDAQTLEDECDALIDLLVFTLGSLERHGFPCNKAFEEVMRANMEKSVGATTGKPRSGFKLDLVKPENFQPADIAKVLSDYNQDLLLCR